MADALAQAINDSHRIPNIILSASVFNYQRIDNKMGEIALPFVNIGTGGYARLHEMSEGVTIGKRGE
jgi:hypothetical protein